MKVWLQVVFGLTDLTSLVGFWRIKKLKKGIGVVLSSYIFLFVPMYLSSAYSIDEITILSFAGFCMGVAWRMYWLYDWTTSHNAQNLNTNNSENQ
jgi:hypothetical protein